MMIDETDRDYYQARASSSRRQADLASTQEAAAVHRQLADRYDAVLEQKSLPEAAFD